MQAVLVQPTQFKNVMIASAIPMLTSMQRITKDSEKLMESISGLDLNSPKVCADLLKHLAPVVAVITKAKGRKYWDACKVVEIVCATLGETVDRVNSHAKSQVQCWVDVRQACFYYLRKYTNMKYRHIGKLMQGCKAGPFDIKTVKSGIIQVQNRIDTKEWDLVAMAIETKLNQ